MQLDALVKKHNETTNYNIQKLTNGYQYTKTTEDKKMYFLNKCPYSN